MNINDSITQISNLISKSLNYVLNNLFIIAIGILLIFVGFKILKWTYQKKQLNKYNNKI